MRLILSESYSSMTVNDLCAVADVKKGSFYHFFPTKRDLVLAAIDMHWERHRIQLFDAAFAPDIPPLARITRFFRLLTPWVNELALGGTVLGCPFGDLGAEMATQDVVIREKIREVFGHIAEYFARAIQDACAANEIHGVDVEAAAGRLLAYLEGLYLLAKLENDPEIFVRNSRIVVKLIHEDGTG
jgi:TetR/AcrR family transcriptional repressor of nem operon